MTRALLGDGLLRGLADVFDVNPRMVLFRCIELAYIPASVDQERLVLDM